jgi:hypothetical protein
MRSPVIEGDRGLPVSASRPLIPKQKASIHGSFSTRDTPAPKVEAGLTGGRPSKTRMTPIRPWYRPVPHLVTDSDALNLQKVQNPPRRRITHTRGIRGIAKQTPHLRRHGRVRVRKARCDDAWTVGSLLLLPDLRHPKATPEAELSPPGRKHVLGLGVRALGESELIPLGVAILC